MNLSRNLLALGIFSFFLAFGSANAGDPKYRRLKDHAPSPEVGNGVLIFSQIKSNKHDLVWAFDFGLVGAFTKSSVGREMRWPNGFYDIGCDRVGSVVALSLPPGQYELGPWKIDPMLFHIGPTWSIGRTYDGPKTKILIPIKADRLTYVGQISIDEAAGNTASIVSNFECEKPYIAATWPWMLQLPTTLLKINAPSREQAAQ